MTMTPARVAERVELLIESIHHGGGHSFADHNVARILDYIEQLLNLGIISDKQFMALVIAVNEMADNWRGKVDEHGLLVPDDLDHCA